MRKSSSDAKRRQLQRSVVQGLEPLESRVLLAVGVKFPAFDPHNIPVPTTPTSNNIADPKNGPMANTQVGLVDLYRDYRRFRNQGGSDANYQPSGTIGKDLLLDEARVGVTLRYRGSLNAATDALRAKKAEIIYRSGKYAAIDAMVPISMLHELARDPNIGTLNPMSGFQTMQQGSANNQADAAQRADLVRSLYGLDGTGVRIGVLSDSANAVGFGIPGSVATGDLPNNVIVLSDLPRYQTVTDEGRAMLELIHDIAPGAQLMFATVGTSQLEFADNIRALHAAGADIIVDDVLFFAEPFFQAGVVEQAVADVVNAGTVYLSSAGNFSDSGFTAPTNFTKIGRDTFVDFDPGPGVDTRMRVEVAGGTIHFQWDNPYNGVVGNTTTDLDIYFYDPNYPKRIIAVGNTNNLRTGVPVERIDLRNGAFDMEIRVADHTLGTQLPTRFQIAGNFGLGTTEYAGVRNAIMGHHGAPETIAVGAVPFYNAPPFADPGETIESEDFSSFGPSTRIFDGEGNRFPTPLVFQKPDVSGIDATNTSFFGSDIGIDDDVFPNFSGTSAAAPNVAAVVALMRQAAPTASPEAIASALRATAIPINGANIGEYDEQGGFGLIDAVAAIEQFVQPPTVTITPVSPDPTESAVSNIEIRFSQQVTGFDISDLTLSVDGGPNLLTGDNTLTTNDGGRTWLLRNLAPLTTDAGVYQVALVEGNGIVNTVGLELVSGTSESWTKMPPPPRPTSPSALQAKIISDSSVRLRWSDNTSDEAGFTIQRSENESFTANVKTIHVPANTTVYTDVGVPQGKQVYYRVRARNSAGVSSYSNITSVVTLSTGEVILDNESTKGVTVTGSWSTTSSTPGFYGSSYLDDNNSGKGAKSVRYRPNLPKAGDYFVYVRYTQGIDRATNVPVDIIHDGGDRDTVVVDQRNNGGNGWVLLGKYRFQAGTDGSVTIRTAGTNGRVIADAVRFLPAGT